MTTSTITRDRRHADPVIFAANLKVGDVFLDQASGLTLTVNSVPWPSGEGIELLATRGDSNVERFVTLDPAQLVNLEGRSPR